MIGVTVNYFQMTKGDEQIEFSALLCLSLLRIAPEVSQIVLVDGSPQPNDRIKSYCDTRGIIYTHFGRELTFSETYNLGIGQLDTYYVCTMASDVFVRPDTFKIIGEFINTADESTLGCVIPYLSYSDLPGQARTSPGPTRISPLMTLNLNVFPRAVLDAIGGGNDEFSGCFNDFIMAKKISDLGRKIYLVDAFAVHYGRLTLNSGSTRVDYPADEQRMVEKYPELLKPGSRWHLDLTKFRPGEAFRNLFEAGLELEGDATEFFHELVVSRHFLQPLAPEPSDDKAGSETGRRRTEDGVEKILRDEIARARKQAAELRDTLTAADVWLGRYSRKLAALRRSPAWKITRPFRRIASQWRRGSRRRPTWQ